jgi:hypothetical protein
MPPQPPRVLKGKNKRFPRKNLPKVVRISEEIQNLK